MRPYIMIVSGESEPTLRTSAPIAGALTSQFLAG
jgi:hypothetical protein